MRRYIIVAIAMCSFTMITFSMDRDDLTNRVLISVMEMQEDFSTIKDKDKDFDVLSKFNELLYLPLLPIKKDDPYLEKEVIRIKHKHYEALRRYSQELYNHVENSAVWTFVRLPIKLQRSIVEKMMGYDVRCQMDDMSSVTQENAIDIFMKTPLLHALDRYSRLNLLVGGATHTFFLTLNPYEKKYAFQENEALKLSICLGGAIGLHCAAAATFCEGVEYSFPLSSPFPCLKNVTQLTFFGIQCGTGIFLVSTGIILGAMCYACRYPYTTKAICKGRKKYASIKHNEGCCGLVENRMK